MDEGTGSLMTRNQIRKYLYVEACKMRWLPNEYLLPRYIKSQGMNTIANDAIKKMMNHDAR